MKYAFLAGGATASVARATTLLVIMRKIFPILLLAGSSIVAVMIFAQNTPENIVVTDPKANLITDKESFSPEPIPDIPTATANAAIQDIGVEIAEEIIAQNPDGPELIEDEPRITAPDPKKIAEQIIKERLSQSSFALLTPEIDINSIKIVPNDDPAFIDGYLQSAKAISDRNFAGINMDFSDPDIEEFKKLAAAYEKTIQEYYTLNVPASFADLHKKKLTLFMQQKKIFTNIANIEKDPLAALISMRLIGRAYNDLTGVNAQIVQFAKKYNL